VTKTADMNAQEVIRLLTIANDDLPSVEYRCEMLKREVNSLEGSIKNSTMIVQELSDQISYSHDILDSNRSSCQEEKRQIHELHHKKMKLESLVNDFQNDNEEYVKFTKTVEEKIIGTLSNAKVLL
jgi:chromosome segregation ATPase